MKDASEAAEPERPAAEEPLHPLARVCFWLGVVSLSGTVLALLGISSNDFYEAAGLLLFPALFTSFLTVFLSLIAVFFFRKQDGKAGNRSEVLLAGAMGLVCFFLVSAGDLRLGTRDEWPEASAVSSLQMINTALARYGSDFNVGFPDTLNKLGPKQAEWQERDINNADLLDYERSGRAEGGSARGFVTRRYKFTYAPGPADKDGKITTYTVTGRPIRYGRAVVRSFFTDESGVIHATQEDRAATTQDSPL